MTETQTQTSASFTALHPDLSDALKTVSVAVSDKSNIPEFRGVLADTSDGVLTLRAFDYDTDVTVLLPGGARQNGRSLLHFAGLKRVLDAAVTGETAARVRETSVTVDDGVLSTPDVSVPLETLDAGNYPDAPPAAPAQATVDGSDWFRQLARVLPAAAANDTVPELEAVRVTVTKGQVRLAATDRYRAAVADIPADTGGAGAFPEPFYFPAGVLRHAVKLFAKYAGPVFLGVHDLGVPGRVATLVVGPAAFTVRCVVPTHRDIDVTRHFPAEELPLTAEVDRDALARAVRKALALAKARGRSSVVRLRFAAGGLTVAPEMPTPQEDAKVRGIPVTASLSSNGLAAPLRANGSFLLDALGAFAGDAVFLHASSPVKAFLLTDGRSVAGEGYRHLHMPVVTR